VQRIDASNAELHQAGFIGGFYIRPNRLEPHEETQGHEHYVDHVSNILDAPLRIEWHVPGTDRAGVIEVEVPCKILVKAEAWHKFIAYDKPVRWECWFAETEEASGRFHLDKPNG
jgi:hypothetical protein